MPNDLTQSISTASQELLLTEQAYLTCHICKSRARRLFAARDLNNRVSDQEFVYFSCSCGLVFLPNVPKDLSRYYQKAYGAYVHPEVISDMDEVIEKIRFRLELVQQFKSSGSLLEIGPSFGAFSYLAKKQGFDVTALEMDPGCVTFMQETLQLNAIQALDIETQLADLGSFDVICLWHSLEHMVKPWELLPALAKKLKPKGILVIACPNPQSLQAKVMGRFWTHLDAPRHLWLVSSQLLGRILKQHGCRELLVTASDSDSLHFTDFGWAASFKNMSQSKFGKFIGRLLGTAIRFLSYPIRHKPEWACAYTAIYTRIEPNSFV